MFSGGSYEEVARWLKNFLTSHAKREALRAEVLFDEDDALEGRAYRARVHVGGRVSEPLELDYKDVAAQRGELAWCAALAQRVRGLVKPLAVAGSAADAPAR